MKTLLILMSLYTATFADVYVLTKCYKAFDINKQRVLLFGHYRTPTGTTIVLEFETSKSWCPQLVYRRDK